MNDKTPEEWQALLNEVSARNHLKMVEWTMNLGRIVAMNAGLMASAGVIEPRTAAQQVRTIRDLLATDPNTAEVVTQLDELLSLIPGGELTARQNPGEIIPGVVLERLRAMKQAQDADQ